MVKKRIVPFLALASLSLSIIATAQQPSSDVAIRDGTEVTEMLESEQPLRWVPGQVIVKYKTTTHTTSEERLRTMGLTDHVSETSDGAYIYSLPPETIGTMSASAAQDRARTAVAEMSGQAEVEYVQLNYVLHIVKSPDDAGFPLQWHYLNNGSAAGESPGGINLPDAWDRTDGAASSIVAVIDTGILPNHPDIAGSGNLLDGFDMISDSFTANDGDGRDDDPTDPGDDVAAGECGPGSPAEPASWHGSHVAGTIGVGATDNATGVAGVNWDSRVMALRALGRCGGSVVDINDAIRWAAGLPVPGAPTNPNPAKVINMSLGAGAPCSSSPATQSAINDAVAAGVTVVVAAGNEASDAGNSFPASCDNVITVAASDYNGDLVRRYSNFGADVDVMAPGGDLQADDNNDGNPDGVLSTVEGGYAFYNGTSMAAPHVAGVAALLLAQDPNLTPQRVEELIVDNALARTTAQCPRPCGAGLLNADIDVAAPVQPLDVSVQPVSLEIDEGETAAFTATVRRGGVAQAGLAVRFVSVDANFATVSPATATTDSNGKATATVTAVTEGTTRIVASIQGQSASATVDVDVRNALALGIAALILLLLGLTVYGNRKLAASR